MVSKHGYTEDLDNLSEGAFYTLALSWSDVDTEEKLNRMYRIADALAKGLTTAVAPTHGETALEAAVVFNEIGRLLCIARDPLAAIEAYKQAAVAARDSQRSDQIYKSLHFQGFCYLDLQNYTEAARHFQLSIEYANFVWPSDMIRTLELVAHCWQHNEQTVQLAMGLYDWLILLRPERIDIRGERCRCLLACGMTSAVDKDASDMSKTSGYEVIAASIAANFALGDKRRARRRAREGYRIADISQDQTWRRAFASVLD